MYVLSIGQRVIRAARNPDISKLHTLTSHTSQRVSHFTTHFLSKKHNACLFGLYLIVLSCIVLCVRVKGFVFFSCHFLPTIVLFS